MIDVVVVADRERISLGCALNILVAKKAAPNVKFHVGIPNDSSVDNNEAEHIFKKHAASIFNFPPCPISIDSRQYRIGNKLQAITEFGSRPAVLADSDLLFLRPLPEPFLFRVEPCAVPEHGLHVFPWTRLFETVGLRAPSTLTLLGSGEISLPWFNGGFVVCPNAEHLGRAWSMMASYVNACDWVPERFPYLDQISLPLAISQLSSERTIDHRHILPSVFNQNLFYWAGDQSQTQAGFVVHHHNRVRLIEKYFSRVLMWIREDYPIIDGIIGSMCRYDEEHTT